MDKGKTVMEDHMDLQVGDMSGSSLPPTTVPSSVTRAPTAQSEQEVEEMKRLKRRDASREFRKRKKKHMEELEKCCQDLYLKNKSLTTENRQLKEKLKKAETDLALLKGKQNEAMKIMTNGLRMLED